MEKDPNYIKEYEAQIKKGKSAIYAKQYALHYLDGISPDYCELYASKYEECINKGRDDHAAAIIATEYEDLYDRYWPEDNNYLGIEAHKVYMKGFEYAIDNVIDSPEKFAKEYQAAYHNTGERPSHAAKGEYDDIISKLLANKGPLSN